MPDLLTSSGIALLLSCCLAPPASPQGAEDCARRIEAAPKTHPRLFLTPVRAATVKRRVAADPVLAKAFSHVLACAEAIVRARPVTRKKVGRRLLGVSRTGLKRVVHLAFAYRMTGSAPYLRRAQAEMLAVAAFPDWNPSHFLDVAEMTAALAIGYDWLYADLDPAARAAIREAIVDKGLRTSLRGGWWVTTTNNWNQVCHGGLCLGALAVLEDEPELAARIVARAVKNLPRAMREYAPDGAYPEGPGYWTYGTSYNVLLIDALESVLGTDFGLTKSEGFLQSADYYLQMTGPTGLFFNYSDCGAKGGVAPAMYWFAARRRDPTLLFRERTALDDLLGGIPGSATGASRLLPFLLIWAGPLTEIDSPSATHFEAEGRTPVAVHRSGWGDNATFVAVKGGSPGSNHAHMDIGSFVMDAGGVRWALDLGAQSYQSLESKGIRLWDGRQTGQRWSVFRLGNLAHNTLVVDGKKQVVTGSAPIERSVATGPMPHTIVDLSGIYSGQLAAAKRGVGLRSDRSVLIQDEIEAPDRATVVRWGMVTRAEIESSRGGTAVLARGGRRLTLRVLAPVGVELQTYETAKPPAPHDHPNRGTQMIGFEVELPASARRRLAVLLTPGASETGSPAVTPLADWPRSTFKPMFNGKDLTGWHTKGNWVVKDGNVIALEPRPGESGWKRYHAYLTTDRKYGNFVLDLEFKFEAKGNSGVFLRIGDLKNHVDSGFEVQILDTHGKEKVGSHDCGGVIRTVGPTKNMVKPAGEWNRYTITVIERQLTVVLNGKRIVDIDMSNTPLKNRPARGHISFQDEAKPIWYRNVRIKELE